MNNVKIFFLNIRYKNLLLYIKNNFRKIMVYIYLNLKIYNNNVDDSYHLILNYFIIIITLFIMISF